MTIPAEIVDALVTTLETPNVQAALVAAITAGEVPLEGVIDNAINALKGSGILGVVIAASKGSIETEINAEFTKIPPATIAAYITKLAQDEAKNLGG